MLFILTQFISKQSQHVEVHGCLIKLINVVSGVPRGCVLRSQLFLLCTAELFAILENKLYGYADDSTLVAAVPSLADRVAVAESLNCDLN